jgi:hypothetical protein
MKRERFENPWAWSAFGRARSLAHAGREPEAFETLRTAMMASGWAQRGVSWGRNESPASLWQTWLRLGVARDLLLLRMILQPRERWIDAWNSWKETVRELAEEADRVFVFAGPMWWRTGQRPSTGKRRGV